MTTKGRWFAFLACAVVILTGCRGKNSTASNAPSDAKAQIRKHLAKQAGQKEFTPAIDLDLPVKVATLRSNAATLEQRATGLRATLRTAAEPQRASLEHQLADADRAWEAARIEAARKQEELSNQEDTCIRSVRQQVADVKDYQTLYRLVGQQLATAERLLADTDVSRRSMGLKMAREACGHVNSGGVDVWLAARICEAYLWPNLELADTERRLDLLETCRRVFFDTYETNNVLTNYLLMQATASTIHAADTYRVQLADWLEEKGSVIHAAEILREIQDAQVLASAAERIARVKERAATAR